MQYIAAGKHTRNVRFQAFIHHRAACHSIQHNTHPLGQLIFRYQTHRQEKGIAGIVFFRSRYGPAVIVHLRQRNAFQTFFSPDIHHRMAEFQRDVVILQALYNIPFQTAAIGHQFCHSLYLCPFQRHTPGHNQANIPAAQNHHFPPGHIAFHIDKALGRTGGKNTCRPVPRNIQRPSGPLPASHRQNHGLRLNPEDPFPTVHGRYNLIPANLHYHRIRHPLNLQRPGHFNIASCIFRPGQLFPEGMQAKAVVNTLIQNTACLPVPLQYQNAFHARLSGSYGGGKSRRSAACYHNIAGFHKSPFSLPAFFFVVPVTIRETPPLLVTSSIGTASSRLSSSITLGAQKPD